MSNLENMFQKQCAQMKFLVVGCGSIGKRHLGNLKFLGADRLMAVDPDESRRQEVVALFDLEAFASLDSALQQSPHVALICTPNSLHLEGAMAAARAGCHLFVEKPLSHTLKGVAGLIQEVEKKGLVTLIGCNFKFHPSFAKMKAIIESGDLGRILSARCQFGQYLPDWHPWEDYRKTYSARSDLGGGILLDSHEIDYMQWFLGDVSELFCFAAKVSNLEIDTEDTAAVLLKFKSGTIAQIHLDYTQRAYQRNYEFFGENGTLKWNFADGKVCLYLASANKWKIFEEPRNYDLNEMYKEEMKHFIGSIKNGKKTATDVFSGWRTLQIIMAAKESAIDGQKKTLEGVC
jgi:predicted dehydrogenase